MGPSMHLHFSSLWLVLISFGVLVFVLMFAWLGWPWICITCSVVSVLSLYMFTRKFMEE